MTRDFSELKESILLKLSNMTDTERIKRAPLGKLFSATERDVTEAVRQLVEEGYPIINNGQGYYLSKDPAKIESAAAMLDSQGTKMRLRAQRLRMFAKGVNQISLGA
jgi:biotin operon repressor